MTEETNTGVSSDSHFFYVVYNNEGRILQGGSCPKHTIEDTVNSQKNISLITGEDRYVIEVDGIITNKAHYVKDGEVAEREEMPTITLTQENRLVTLEGLPVPCQIKVDAEIYECNENHASISFDYSGTHTFTVIAFPYLDWVSEVTV